MLSGRIDRGAYTMTGTRLSCRLLLALGIFCAVLDGHADDAAFEACLKETVEREALAGMSAAVAINGALRWSGGAGFADVENEVPMRGDTVHRIASISKPIAAVGAMLLVQRGTLSLDDTARKFVASWPERYPPITLRQLLSHTSGIRHYRGGEASTMTAYPHMRRALHAFKDDALDAQPGEKYLYTTYGYTLMGAMMEAAAGERLHPFLKREVWEPAGMVSTTFEFAGELVPRRASGYTRDSKGALRNAPYTDLSVKYAGGGMISTAEDLVRFGLAFEQGHLVDTATRDSMLERATLNDGSKTGYGLGWNIGKADTKRSPYSHSGGQAGTSTHLAIHPQEGIVIAILCNVDGAGGAVSAVNRKLLELARKLPLE
ncbi:MAG: hypothetical protein RLZZ303_447 [Candidatus Hydrogenedentota bacterium]|jgi:CubicO group peptidase (beta-lactamase class C family)